MKIDGGCHCGAITYEAEVDPEKVVVCHCTDCQTLSGSAFRTVVMVPEEDFTLKSGTLKTYVKTAESGNPRAQVFCPECGSHIYATSVGDGPKVLGIRVGTVHQRDQLPPKRQVWTRSAQHWLHDLDQVPGKETV
ncbi:MAG: GFA family protein [Alphaproteobacteria bacterium]|nr:GFA family protein [Alphaproteobacteria bacterium]